jgi:outer membrane protein
MGAARRAVGIALAVLAPAMASAQQTGGARPLSLDDAFRLAEPSSDDVRIAQNAVLRAKGQYYQARASVSPQITATANYQRLLQNQIAAFNRRFPQPTNPNQPPDTIPNVFNTLFGSPNTITLGLSASQPLFLDNRFALAGRVARANEDVAKYGLRTARAQLRYDIASAYFDAVIAEKLLQIADSTLRQNERTLQQTTLQRQVGTVAEYDLLRSRVARDAQRPQLLRAEQQRDVAVLRLKQLLNLPLNEPIDLTTPVQDADMDRALAASRLDNDSRPSAGIGIGTTAVAAPKLTVRDTAADSRTAIQQAKANIVVLKGQLQNAGLQRLPSLQLSTNYQRFAYPSNSLIVPRTFADFYPNWTVALGLSVPVWTSGRITGEQMVARANLADGEARLSQGQRAAALDVQLALKSLEAAEATWLASVGTVEQADKALRISEVRYTNGISTQLELTDIRNLLIQAQANALSAARELQLARLRMTLLRDLPLGSGGGVIANTGAQAQQPMQQAPQAATQTTAAAGANRGTTGAGGRP